MRIGLFTDTYLPDINGVVSSTVTLKNALEKAGHTVFVVTNHAGAKIELDGDVLRLPGIALKGLYGYKMSSPISIGALTYIRNMHLDVIHLQTNFGIGLYGQTLGKSLGIPLVDTYHTMYEDYTHYINPHGFAGFEKLSREAIRAASRKVCNSVQAVISPSQKTKEILEEYGVIAPIYVCPTGLSLDAFDQADQDQALLEENRKKVSDDPDLRLMIFLGRIAKEKSIEMIIDSLDYMNDPHFHLAIYGDGPDLDYYRELAEKSGSRDRIHFMGRVDPSDVPAIYAAADAYISASLSETQGMTYLESMAAGTMVFGRRDEVLDGLIDEGKTGYYFDTPQELVEKIESFYRLPEEQRKENRQLCKAKVAPYTDKTFAHKMAAVYDQAILDYSKTYTVEKIKFKDDLVYLTVFRDSDKEDTHLYIPMQDYFDLKISPGVRLDSYHVESYLKNQKQYLAWNAVKKRALSRDLTQSQAIRYLITSQNLDRNDARLMVDELVNRSLVDDRAYAVEKAQYWQSLGYSTSEIRRKLFKAGIDSALIKEAVLTLKEDLEVTNAKKLANRLVSTVKNQSVKLKKQTIRSKLISRGYSAQAAADAVSSLEFEEDDDSSALQAAFEKAERMYRHEEPAKRTQKIRQYCIRKGFSMQDVNELLESVNSYDS